MEKVQTHIPRVLYIFTICKSPNAVDYRWLFKENGSWYVNLLYRNILQS